MTYNLPTGHWTEEIDPDEQKEITTHFQSWKGLYEKGIPLMRAYPCGTLLPSNYEHKLSPKMGQFKFSKEDVVVFSFPKSGTNFVSDVVWKILHNKNLESAFAKATVMLRTVWLESDLFWSEAKDTWLESGKNFYTEYLHPGDTPETDEIFFKSAEASPGPRVLKSHLPLSFFNNILDSCRAIYVLRDPKDVVVSLEKFSHIDFVYKYTGSFDQFLNYFMQDKIIFSPYWKHVKAAWDLKGHPNLLFVYYEELVKNPKKEYTKIKDFLGVDISPENIDKIIDDTNFVNMRERESGFIKDLNEVKGNERYFNSGTSGNGEKIMTEGQNVRMDSWIKKNKEEIGMET